MDECGNSARECSMHTIPLQQLEVWELPQQTTHRQAFPSER